jgi:SAM-dependent methyltransferase
MRRASPGKVLRDALWRWHGEPGASVIDWDAPEAVDYTRARLESNPFLRRLYEELYRDFGRHAAELRGLPGELVELGSGGGFLKDLLPEVITSDIVAHPKLDRILRADRLDLADRSVKGFFLLNVLHHVGRPEDFFREAARCLVPGGRVVMIEPHRSRVGRLFHRHCHRERWDEAPPRWQQAGGGRAVEANNALPWIIFWRDRALFEARFPELRVRSRTPRTLLGFLLSGGFTWRRLAPAAAFPLVSWADRQLARAPGVFPMFQTIVLERS